MALFHRSVGSLNTVSHPNSKAAHAFISFVFLKVSEGEFHLPKVASHQLHNIQALKEENKTRTIYLSKQIHPYMHRGLHCKQA